jgi:hypothetical protein
MQLMASHGFLQENYLQQVKIADNPKDMLIQMGAFHV